MRRARRRRCRSRRDVVTILKPTPEPGVAESSKPNGRGRGSPACAREEHREERVRRTPPRSATDRGRLGQRVVAASASTPPLRETPGVVACLNTSPVRSTPGPCRTTCRGTPSYLAAGTGWRADCRTPRRAEVFVDARDEDDVVLAQQIGIALEREIEAAERRAAISGDQRGSIEPATLVGVVLVRVASAPAPGCPRGRSAPRSDDIWRPG